MSTPNDYCVRNYFKTQLRCVGCLVFCTYRCGRWELGASAGTGCKRTGLRHTGRRRRHKRL